MRRNALMTLGAVLNIWVLVGCATSHITLPLEHDEREIKRSEVPTAALQRLESLAGEHSITEFEWEDRGTFIAYEAEWLVEGVEEEATVLADGSLIETERELRPDEFETLPSAIQARVEQLKAGGYEVSVARRGFIIYEVDGGRMGEAEMTTGEDETEDVELLLRPDGASALRER